MSKQDTSHVIATGSGVTPHDLRNANFRRTLKGYDTAQVNDLLHRAGIEVEILLTERDELAERLKEIERADIENKKQVRDLENLLQTHERRSKQNEQILSEKEKKIQALFLEKSSAPNTDSLALLTTDLASAEREIQQLKNAIKSKDETISALKEKLDDGEDVKSKYQSLAAGLAERDLVITKLKAELELSRQAQPVASNFNIPDMLTVALSSVEDVLSAARQFLSHEANAIIKDAELEAATIRKNTEIESDRHRKEIDAAALMAEKQIHEYSQFLERQIRALPSLPTQKEKNS